MSLQTLKPPRQPVAAGAKPAAVADTPPAPVEFHFTQSESFPALLEHLGASLLVTTYQANKLLVLRARQGGLSILVRSFERPMGLAADPKRIALGTRDQVWQFRNAPDLAARVDPAGSHDACFLPRASHVTGDIGVHEIAWAARPDSAAAAAAAASSAAEKSAEERSAELWLVSTRFSCLCTLDPAYSFVPRWRPPFVTALAAEDRCHLNGVAIVDDRPRYATALGRTDAPGGWRAGKARGGCVMSVPDGDVVADGLCMPHSPRWHDQTLWVLESGTGTLRQVNPATRAQRVVTAGLPGFARGLALCGPYAFIGLSKIRATSAMDGVPLADRRADLKCGIAVVDLRTGGVIATVEFQTAVEEVFDVQILAGNRFPEVLGFQQQTIQHTFVVPPAGGNSARAWKGSGAP